MTLPLWTPSQIAAARYMNRCALARGMAITLGLEGGVPVVEGVLVMHVEHLRVELDDAESMREVDGTLDLLTEEELLPPVLVEMLRFEQRERLNP